MRDEEILIPIVAIGGPLLLVAYNITAKTLSRVVCHWRDTTLKIRLAETGFSPTEIERVVSASSRESGRRAQNAGPQQTKAEKPPIHLGANRDEEVKRGIRKEVAV